MASPLVLGISANLSFLCACGLSLLVVLLVDVVNPNPNPPTKSIDWFCYFDMIYF